MTKTPNEIVNHILGDKVSRNNEDIECSHCGKLITRNTESTFCSKECERKHSNREIFEMQERKFFKNFTNQK